MAEEIENALNALAHKIIAGGETVEGLKRLSGGASQETWAFVVQAGGGSHKCILRRAPGGGGEARSSAAITLPGEAALIDAAIDQGVRAPPVRHVCNPGDGLGEAFIMAHVEGETIARKLLRDDRFSKARVALTADCGSAIAGIHAIPLSAVPNDVPPSSGLDQIEKYFEIYTGFETPRPVFELAFKWLKDNAPAPVEPVLVHGDFRIGNLMVNETGLAAVLDWELAHIGDPREDLGWICVNSWRFGQSHNRVGGFGQLEDLLSSYAAAGGAKFTVQDIAWWETLGTLKWGVMCMIMYEAFRSGADPSVERAAIGRRVSETEIDLINLFERL